jgi:hypothetical protein
MERDYDFRGAPLQPHFAKLLILEVLRERGTMQRAELASEVQKRHMDRGGNHGQQSALEIAKKALSYLEDDGLVERAGGQGRWRLTDVPEVDEPPAIMDTVDIADFVREGPALGEGCEAVYLYFHRNDRLLAIIEGRDVWECKIGRARTDVRSRVLEQKTGVAHPPVLGLELRTDTAAALERELHSHLREIDAEVEDSPGAEWFYTSPERIDRWFRHRRALIDCLRATVS